MRKILTYILALSCVLGLTACTNSTKPEPQNEIQSQSDTSRNTLVVYFSMPETTDSKNMTEEEDNSTVTDKFGLKKDSYILFLGRLVPEKGIRYLVEAFKNVKTDKKLVIAGGSSDTDSFMEELKELAKGDDRILFTGFVQGAMLDELYSNAYIYTLPSDLEGMPLSLLEAMSYGNCCLVSDIPECTEVVEDKALIFEKSNVEDLQEKLQDACEHPEMVMNMKKQAADFICEKYNWDEVVKETMKLYRRK